MLPSILRRLRAFSRRLLVRVVLIAFLSVCAIALAKIFGRLIPPGLSGLVGADAVDRILSIIANSMLAVTTFSLTIMVASHRAVSSLWTPRAHQVMLQDTTTHTVLATFVGAYIYAIIVIILRETQVFEGEELLVLFAVTLVVVALILIAIVRWIMHLEMLGSLIETAQKIETQAQLAYDMWVDHPNLACSCFHYSNILDSYSKVLAAETGYLQQIYQDRLGRAAQDCGADVHVPLPIGSFVHKGDVLAYMSKSSPKLRRAVLDNISIGTLRNYTQDPVFALMNLAEIGQRALSPGVNDPGTATDMVRRIARVLVSNHGQAQQAQEPQHKRLYLAPLDRGRMVHDTLGAMLFHGRGQPELLEAMNQSMAVLLRHADPEIAGAALDLSAEIAAAAQDSLSPALRGRLGLG